jgi:hypothetical protein
MSAEENKALVRRGWDEVFNKKNLDFIDEFSVADVIRLRDSSPNDSSIGS